MKSTPTAMLTEKAMPMALSSASPALPPLRVAAPIPTPSASENRSVTSCTLRSS